MKEVRDTRDHYFAEGHHGMVLAANHSLASRASRALAALRASEELSGHSPVENADRLRDYLTTLQKLPALPMHELGSTPRKEIERRYNQYVAEGIPAEARAGERLGIL
jgi:hypothetical protein